MKNDFLIIIGLKSSICIFFLSFFCLIKWLFHEYLAFMFWVVIVLSIFSIKTIQTDKADLINEIYKITVVSIY